MAASVPWGRETAKSNARPCRWRRMHNSPGHWSAKSDASRRSLSERRQARLHSSRCDTPCAVKCYISGELGGPQTTCIYIHYRRSPPHCCKKANKRGVLQAVGTKRRANLMVHISRISITHYQYRLTDDCANQYLLTNQAQAPPSTPGADITTWKRQAWGNSKASRGGQGVQFRDKP